ncbi:hypothetical protein BDV95DRAFT_605222 [Massariosphaeria phaeospora]|uniref:F-box domain-containing protein n=1 Tax=Massariosphaeria phaeospora TaxID=100035 RepID=A0A7C8MHY0_9PLEO|nr:hypothetical protein BDV95DRAFT_605222 [Massariosphaeria phaeospora]
MPLSAIELPCRSHYSCAYHKHWCPPRPSQHGDSPDINRSGPQPSDENHNHNNNPASSTTSIQSLPAEIIFSIAAYLAPLEKASLALSCRSLASTLGSAVWKQWSKAGGASWFQHAEFLDFVQRDYASETWWLCRPCVSYHPRTKQAPKEIPERSFKQIPILNAIFNSEHRSGGKHLRIGPSTEALYIVDFPLLKAIMDRHHLGAPYGVCLNSLRCQGQRTYAISATSNLLVHHAFQPKIVLDRVLLHAVFTFSAQPTMFIRNMSTHDMPLADFLATFDLSLCAHTTCADALRQARTDGMDARRDARHYSCVYCPTQCSVTALAQHSLRICVWQNLGAGRSEKDRRWKHVVQRGRRKKKYAWAKENVAQAFGSIWCSTMDEFQRQVQRSDGLGQWYDPELGRRAYKSLPVKVAERL